MYVNPTGYGGPTRSASFPTEVNNVLTRFVPSAVTNTLRTLYEVMNKFTSALTSWREYAILRNTSVRYHDTRSGQEEKGLTWQAQSSSHPGNCPSALMCRSPGSPTRRRRDSSPHAAWEDLCDFGRTMWSDGFRSIGVASRWRMVANRWQRQRRPRRVAASGASSVPPTPVPSRRRCNVVHIVYHTTHHPTRRNISQIVARRSRHPRPESR
jgi:hypothetical protein